MSISQQTMRMLCGHLKQKNTDAQWASEVKKCATIKHTKLRASKTKLKWRDTYNEDPSSDKTGRRLQC